ncbi:MAG: hypothetical protein KIY12_06040 [Thermoplasmata archaeon]|uniref:Uncharacterized protein n=1 Tax=Candidatus Sysuiplasma superficiale TaxID=2823368 RepID=A0A8J7YS73_9ARCH|nr:hypothetical protein [Candidatus Sysuiplasma superficiale]MBX8644266.1 hypothetical protein [Candidatus Sysuiplasma superficiale]MCL4346877.1 hypothetical protein [Candidatus Thermoplasmatota archaeon]
MPARCGECPFFIQTFTQELKRRTPEGLKAVPVLTGLCGAMRLSEIRAEVPKYETTHRRAADSACYFSSGDGQKLGKKVAWLIDRQRMTKTQR